MNLLYITELEPFPPDRGERIRSYHLINSLLEFSDRMVLLAGNEPPVKKRYEKVEYVPMPGLRTRNRWINLLFLFFRNRSLMRLLSNILDRHEIDQVFLDYDFLGHYIRFFKGKGIRVTYGTHNVQSYLNIQRPVTGWREKLYVALKFRLEKLHEKRYFKKADLLIGVSDEDIAYYRHRLGITSLCLIPNYIDEKEYRGYDGEKGQQVIMTGNFNAFQNYAGLKWFLEHVWDSGLSERAELLIAGHGSKEKYDTILKEGMHPDRVKALGSVDDLKGLIARSIAAIIPLQHGSGTRLKCVEAMALKTSIVSTSVGAEGIRHNGAIVIADDPGDFKKGLLRVLNGEINNEEAAYRVFLEEYSSSANTERLKAALLS